MHWVPSVSSSSTQHTHIIIHYRRCLHDINVAPRVYFKSENVLICVCRRNCKSSMWIQYKCRLFIYVLATCHHTCTNNQANRYECKQTACGWANIQVYRLWLLNGVAPFIALPLPTPHLRIRFESIAGMMSAGSSKTDRGCVMNAIVWFLHFPVPIERSID